MNFILSTAGTVVIEIVGNPARFFGSLALGLILGLIFVWACWKVGRLWNTAFRPGLGTLLLAVGGGVVLFVGVVILSATGYSQQLAQTIFAGDGNISSLGEEAAQRCSEIKAALPYLNRYLESPLSIDCDSPVALSALRQQLQSRAANIDRGVRDRLFWNQFAALGSVVLAAAACLGWPSWRAYRGIAVAVQASDT